jgi:glycosyltransferase involved in cell wall biosynthesis
MSRVSVVIPVFNGERYLAEAIETALAQDGTSVDIIVVDDGSTDRSVEIATGFGAPVRVICQAHAGLAAARNTGTEQVESEFLAFLDADDLWLPGKLIHQLAVLRDDPAVSVVFGHVEQFISPDLTPAEQAQLWCDPRPMPGFIPSTLLMRSASLAITGRWDTSLVLGEFIDWHARARDAGLVERLHPATLARRRLHRSNMGIRHRDARSDYARVVKSVLDRRRTTP